MTFQVTLKCTHLSSRVFVHFPTFGGINIWYSKITSHDSSLGFSVTENGGGCSMHGQKVVWLYGWPPLLSDLSIHRQLKFVWLALIWWDFINRDVYGKLIVSWSALICIDLRVTWKYPKVDPANLLFKWEHWHYSLTLIDTQGTFKQTHVCHTTGDWAGIY